MLSASKVELNEIDMRNNHDLEVKLERVLLKLKVNNRFEIAKISIFYRVGNAIVKRLISNFKANKKKLIKIN